MENEKLKIEVACEEALTKLEKLKDDQLEDVRAKLEWVLGSYRNDGNPEGLYEIGKMAFETLSDYKVKKPRTVSKKLLDDLNKAVEKHL
ncbi:MAG: hypothetical protein LAT68_04895 [Cyclobacteriaceae bacterium]|nr:hypothetical protein [Cyclobacteriaceae bacterium]MCH8515649.1 hypothetical protein [Cyclobacteriaceae bacterium]